MKIKVVWYLFILIFINSCETVELPKPHAYLRLDYPEPNYVDMSFGNTNSNFQINNVDTSVFDLNIDGNNDLLLSKKIIYPSMKAEILLEYYKISKNNKLSYRLKNLNDFTSIHLKKISSIAKVQEFIDDQKRVYASIINIRGDVTSPYQFYATDSTTNLVIGILNLKAKTKYDSILPSLNYLKNDIYHLIESINWNDN
jgi:gliding motility-associated lipoprotein GldD